MDTKWDGDMTLTPLIEHWCRQRGNWLKHLNWMFQNRGVERGIKPRTIIMQKLVKINKSSSFRKLKSARGERYIKTTFLLTLISLSQFVGEARAAGAGQVQAEWEAGVRGGGAGVPQLPSHPQHTQVNNIIIGHRYCFTVIFWILLQIRD